MAERRYNGSSDGDIGNYLNYDDYTVPASGDTALFDGSWTNNPVSGEISCDGVGFTGGTIEGGKYTAPAFDMYSGATFGGDPGAIVVATTFTVHNTCYFNAGDFTGVTTFVISSSYWSITGGNFTGHTRDQFTNANISGGTFTPLTIYWLNGPSLDSDFHYEPPLLPWAQDTLVLDEHQYGSAPSTGSCAALTVINERTIAGGTWAATSVDNTGGTISAGIFTGIERASVVGGTVAAAPATTFLNDPEPSKYWYSTGSTDWTSLSNWWDDVGHTVPAASLPTGTTPVVILGPVSPVVDVGVWTQPNSIDCTAKRAVFTNSTAPSRVIVSCAITGDCEFGTGIDVDSAITGGCDFRGDSTLTMASSGVTGTARFYDSSTNNGPIIGSVYFSNSSSNSNTSGITGEATFMGGSENLGTITGNAIFSEKSTDSGSVSGWKASDCSQKDDDFGKYVWETKRAGMKSFIKTGV